jgi:hypothetical protein
MGLAQQNERTWPLAPADGNRHRRLEEHKRNLGHLGLDHGAARSIRNERLHDALAPPGRPLRQGAIGRQRAELFEEFGACGCLTFAGRHAGIDEDEPAHW